MLKTCSFFGHRKIAESEGLKQRIRSTIVDLIEKHNVRVFLFGSRSEFDTLCHAIVTDLQELYPEIKRIAFTCRSEYACLKEEKEERERIFRTILKRDIRLKDYEGAEQSERVYNAGKASYVERNQDIIDKSDYCVFYYNPFYLPPKRRLSKRDISEYQPKSGTQLALDYAYQRKRGGKDITVINLYEEES